MKKKIAIMFTLILAAGTFTACTAEEKANNDIRTSVVSKTADVSVSETTFVSNTTSKIETTVTAETTVNPHSIARNKIFENGYQIRRKSRQWAKSVGCFGN